MIYISKELREAWVAALRGDKYRQGHGALCFDGAYCCLGVLADLLADTGQGKWAARNSGCSSEYTTDGYASGSFLPGTVVSPALQSTLSRMNDTEHKSFKEIADFVEEYI